MPADSHHETLEQSTATHDWQHSFVSELPPLPGEHSGTSVDLAAALWPTESTDDAAEAVDGPAAPGYRLVRKLGGGAMGEVYLARHLRLGRLVALKVIRAEASGPQWRARFLAEAQAVARLQHPNIVQIYEVGESADRPYLALEYVAGGSLAERLHRCALAPGAAASLVQVLARAVQHAHDRGIIHRDLKPANVLLQELDCPKVADFGLASIDPGARSEGIVGTPSYMAPEQDGRSGGRVGPWTDIYALGSVLYECLCGRPPFRGRTIEETLAAVHNQPPPDLPATVPHDLRTICAKCLEKQPQRRYASATDLADDLGRFLRGEPILARPVGTAERLWKWARRRPVVAGLLGLLTLAGITLVVVGAIYQSLLRESLKQTERQRSRAEANYQQALAAVDRLLSRVGSERLTKVPGVDEVRAELLEDALAFYSGFLKAAEEPDPALRWETARAHMQVGKIEQLLGRNDVAENHYRAGVSRFEQLSADFPGRGEYRDALADARLRLGQLLGPGAKSADAGSEFEQARTLWAAMSADARVADCDHAAGAWHQSAGRLNDAEACYQRALEKRRELVAADGTDAARRDLAMSLHNLAGLCLTVNRRGEALPYQTEAVQLFEQLARSRPNDEESRRLWAAGLHTLGVLHAWSGKHDKARQSYEQAIQLREALARFHPNAPDFQGSLARTYLNLAAVDLDTGRGLEAEKHTRQGVAILQRVVDQYPQDWEQTKSLIGAMTNLALMLQSTKRMDEAESVYLRAIALCEALIQAQPGNPHFTTSLSALSVNRGNLEKFRKRHRESLPWYGKSIRAADAALARDSRLMEARRWRLNAYGSRARALDALQEYDAAVSDWDAVVEQSPPDDVNVYRLFRSTALARARMYQRLDAEAESLSPKLRDAPSFHHLAESCAAAAAKASGDDRLSAGERTEWSRVFSRRTHTLMSQAILAADWRGRGELIVELFRNPELRRLPPSE